jgi:hypothetical protein
MTYGAPLASDMAGARYHSVALNTTVSVGLAIKPTSQEYFGNANRGFSYNSSTGVWTLDSTKKYIVEADCFFGWSGTPAVQIIHGFFDQSATELSDSFRGTGRGYNHPTYYGTYSLVSDETAQAVIDGSVTTSFTWEIIALASSVATTVTLNPTSAAYSQTATRLVLREY